jgi:hypothetical protein
MVPAGRLGHNFDSDGVAPAKVDNLNSGIKSKELPTKPSDEYTRTSGISALERPQLVLRLQISKRLYGAGITKTLVYQDVVDTCDPRAERERH